MNPWKGYLRWRHTRGFGVHSPYSYRFVRDVLRPGRYGHYAYHKADHLALSPEYDAWHFRKDIYFLIRLFIFLETKRVIFSSDDKTIEIACKSLGIPCVKMVEEYRLGDLKILKGKQKMAVPSLDNAVQSGVAILGINVEKEIRAELEKPIEKGLLLTSPTKILLIPRQEMEYVSYTINF